MRIAVYGGAFNPPHYGHSDAALAAIQTLKPDKLIFVPSFISPHKMLDDDSPDANERLELLMLASDFVPNSEVSDIEIARGGVSYTVNTLEQLKAQHHNAELFLLMGTDMLLSFESWYEFRRILSLATLAPFSRSSGDEFEMINAAMHLNEKYGADIKIISKQAVELSSSQVRDKLRMGEGTDCLSEEVYARIIQKRHYHARPNLKWLREQTYDCHKPNRISHIRGTESESVMLAERWGADPRAAAEAAILHDMTKKLSHEEQLILCNKYGIICDSVEIESKKLLHAKTAAELARDLFGVTDEVYGAIRWHTTGRSGMSLLEKVVYMADYIEPNREFEGIEELRRLAYEDIDEAIILGLEMSLSDIIKRGDTPHEMTLAALKSLVDGRKTHNEAF